MGFIKFAQDIIKSFWPHLFTKRWVEDRFDSVFWYPALVETKLPFSYNMILWKK